MLQVSGVTKRFGGLTAVDDVSFSIEDEELVGLIGPNGAGKTTLFNTITGIHHPNDGTITFDGTDITGAKPNDVCRHGIVRTFQNVRTFNDSTVFENVLTGAVFGGDSTRSIDEGRAIADRYLEFVDLDGQRDAMASDLTIADRKHVELARGLACEPELLMLDEIGSGLTPGEIDDLADTIGRIRDDLGISVLWIEHIVDAIMGTTERILVLNEGRLIGDGAPAEIRESTSVRQAYLGETQ